LDGLSSFVAGIALPSDARKKRNWPLLALELVEREDALRTSTLPPDQFQFRVRSQHIWQNCFSFSASAPDVSKIKITVFDLEGFLKN
jgi:hypothetical protein